MRKILLASVIFLTSCAAHKVAYQCPILQLPPDPALSTLALTPRSKPNDVIKAWVATAYAYRGWNRVVRTQVENSK